MKNIFVLFLLVFSTNIYSQNIETDPVFLEYEKEYLALYNNAADYNKHDLNIGSFYKSFLNAKAILNFNKSKDKLRWLEKNLDKTSFTTVNEAQSAHKEIVDFEQKYKIKNANFETLRLKVEEKYSGKDVFYTIKKRQEKR